MGKEKFDLQSKFTEDETKLLIHGKKWGKNKEL